VRAHVLIRDQPWYRRDAFVTGLRAAGHDVTVAPPAKPDRDTLLVIWNRYFSNHHLALAVEKAGGRVLVAENGYVGKGGGTPKFDVYSEKGGERGHYYALAEGWHNGGGSWPSFGPGRWEALGVEIKPWREGGKYVLVCPNRSFGVPGRMMPPDWAERKAQSLHKRGYPVKIRRHPGNDAPKRPLSADFADAASVCVWSSSAGVHALIEGLRVECDAPYWILKDWEKVGRQAALARLAWAQYTVEELASGEPFRLLLSPAGEGQVAPCP
jgi:hypothetical protein